MSGRGLVTKTLRDQRGTITGVSLAGMLIAVLMIALYPQIADQFADLELPEFYDIFLGEASIATPEGFLSAEFFSWIPLLFIAVAVIAGTASIASEESNGTLELLLAEPVRRRDIVLRKALALALMFVIISALSLAGIVLGSLVISEFDLGFGRMLAATVLMLFVTWFFLGLSMWASAALPSRGSAAGVVTALIVLAYITDLIGTLVDGLSFLEYLTPFGWADYTDVLLNGMLWLEAMVLLGFCLAFLAAAVISFERRNIGATTWPALRRAAREPLSTQPPGEPERAS